MRNIAEAPPITIVSQNIWFSKALKDMPVLMKEIARNTGESVDIVCFQEAYGSKDLERGLKMPSHIGGLRLAHHYPLGRKVGLAVYYNDKRWGVADARTHQLPPTKWSEGLHLNPKGHRLLEVKLSPKTDQDQELQIDNIHASNLFSTLYGRRDQVVSAAQHATTAKRVVLIGDCNYPWWSEKLLRAVEETGLEYAGPLERESTFRKWPHGTYDRAWTKGLDVVDFSVRRHTPSDHIPISLTVK